MHALFCQHSTQELTYTRSVRSLSTRLLRKVGGKVPSVELRRLTRLGVILGVMLGVLLTEVI